MRGGEKKACIATDREKVSTFSANLYWTLTLGMGYLASWLIASKAGRCNRKKKGDGDLIGITYVYARTDHQFHRLH